MTDKRLCGRCGVQIVTAKCGRCGWLDRESLRRTNFKPTPTPRVVAKSALDELVEARKSSPEIVEFLRKVKEASPQEKVAMRKEMLSRLGGRVVRQK